MPLGVIALGDYVPDRVVANDEISRWADADPSWIAARTGIEERHYAEPELATSDLAVEAAKPLLDALDSPEEIGAVVVATSTPDQPQPATASFVQEKLDLDTVPAFDVNAVCSGFLYALTVAQGLLSTAASGTCALVIGADKYSTIMDRHDRKTVSLFGDGAGAVLLAPVPEGFGVHSSALLADGKASSYVRVEAGGSRVPLTPEARRQGRHLFRMDGRSVKDWGLQFVPKAVHQALGKAGWTVDDIDRAVFHQGNTRLVQALGEALGIESDRLALTAPVLGNTAAASIPLTLAHEHRRRPFQRGERILLASVGGGMTAAAVTLTWY